MTEDEKYELSDFSDELYSAIDSIDENYWAVKLKELGYPGLGSELITAAHKIKNIIAQLELIIK